jgi:hypothetical protein
MEMDGLIDGMEWDTVWAGAGEVSFEENLSRTTVEVTGPGDLERTTEVIEDADHLYMKGQPGTDGWVKRETTSGGMGFGGDRFDPDAFLGYLSEVSQDIRTLGREEIDGARVTHYRAIVNPELMTEGTPELAGYQIEYEPIEVWVDEEGRVRKMHFGMAASGETSGKEFDMRTTVTSSYYDFGVPVEIEIPDDDEVTEEDSLDLNLGGSQTESSEVRPAETPGKGSKLYLTGDEGTDGPAALLARRQWCVHGIPGWAEEVELVDEQAGVLVGSVHLGDAGEEELNVGCSKERLESLKGIERIADSLVLLISNAERGLEVPITNVTRVD